MLESNFLMKAFKVIKDCFHKWHDDIFGSLLP